MSSALSALARFIHAHGMTVRPITRNGGLLCATHGCITRDGHVCTDLSAPISTLAAARRWLGY